MELSVKDANSAKVVALSGELRSEDGPELNDVVHPLISEPGARVIVDLSKLKWVDSGGLGLLISLNTHAKLSKSRVILVNPTKFVAGVLEVTQLDKWFEMADDVDVAQKVLA